MNCLAQIHHPLHLEFTHTSSSQNSSRYRNVSSDLDGEDHEILNILKEMLEGSKEFESVI